MVSSVPFFMSSLFIMVVAYCTRRATFCQSADTFAKPCILFWIRRHHESDSHDRSIGTRDRCPDSGARQCVPLDGASGAQCKRVLVLLGDIPVPLDLVEQTVRTLSRAARVDLAAKSLAGYDQGYRSALTSLLGEHGDLIEIISGEYESLAVPRRSYARQLHKMETTERRYIKQV